MCFVGVPACDVYKIAIMMRITRAHQKKKARMLHATAGFIKIAVDWEEMKYQPERGIEEEKKKPECEVRGKNQLKGLLIPKFTRILPGYRTAPGLPHCSG